MKNKDERWVNVERRQGTDLVSGFVIPLLTPCCSSDKQRNRHFIQTKNIRQDMPHAHAPIHLCCVRNYDTFLGLSVTFFLALVKDSTDMEIYLSESNF